MKKKILILLLFFISTFLYSQKKEKSTLYGIGAVYNFQTEGAAIDMRAKIPVWKNLFVSPRISYFPSFNLIHEYYAGADIGYNLFKYKKLRPYVFASAYYNNWINSSSFKSTKAKKNNFVAEGGGGIIFQFNCLYPFIEGRYDAKWKEGSLGIGIMLKFGECFKAKKVSEKKCAHF